MAKSLNGQSIGSLLLHGGERYGIRVMGLGERLVVIGISVAVSVATILIFRGCFQLGAVP